MRNSLAVFFLLTLTACSLFSPLPEGNTPSKQLSAEDSYNEAKSELNQGDYEAAIKHYESLQSRYPYGRYAQQALLETAYAHYKQGEAESAISAANRFIKQYPKNAHVDYAYYVKGLAHFNGESGFFSNLAGQDPTERDPKAVRDSFAAFNDLLIRFPDSKYAPDSRIRMQYLTNSLAKYELHVANYYLRRGAYIAAVNRAQGILTQFPNSPSTRNALEVMVKSYDELGMTDLRDDTKRVLAANNTLGENLAGNQTEKAWWQFWR